MGRAAHHHGYQLGDLIGVVEPLDYLVDLGINAADFNYRRRDLGRGSPLAAPDPTWVPHARVGYLPDASH
jgi:hypothetical protein